MKINNIICYNNYNIVIFVFDIFFLYMSFGKSSYYVSQGKGVTQITSNWGGYTYGETNTGVPLEPTLYPTLRI